jgi:hypothetical protein
MLYPSTSPVSLSIAAGSLVPRHENVSTMTVLPSISLSTTSATTSPEFLPAHFCFSLRTSQTCATYPSGSPGLGGQSCWHPPFGPGAKNWSMSPAWHALRQRHTQAARVQAVGRWDVLLSCAPSFKSLPMPDEGRQPAMARLRQGHSALSLGSKVVREHRTAMNGAMATAAGPSACC